MQSRYVIKLNTSILFSLFLSVGLLFFNVNLRTRINSSSVLAVNLMVYFAFVFYLIQSRKPTRATKSKVVLIIAVVLVLCLHVICMFLNNLINVRYIIAFDFPLFLLLIQIREIESMEVIFSYWTKVFNIAIWLVVIGGLIDRLFGYTVTNFFTNFYNTDAILQMRIDEPSRIISFLGHPLFASEVSLICFISNYILSEYFEKKNKLLFKAGLCLVACALCGSKTVFLLLLVLVLIFNFNNKRLRNILYLIIGCYILYLLGVFDIIIGRFIKSIELGDWSTGRNVWLSELYQSGSLDFKWFIGHTAELSDRYIIALEYPILRFSYRYGIFYTLCLSIYILRRKQYKILICLVALIIDINTYSSIAAIGDGMLLYCSVLFLFLNISNYIELGSR